MVRGDSEPLGPDAGQWYLHAGVTLLSASPAIGTPNLGTFTFTPDGHTNSETPTSRAWRRAMRDRGCDPSLSSVPHLKSALLELESLMAGSKCLIVDWTAPHSFYAVFECLTTVRVTLEPRTGAVVAMEKNKVVPLPTVPIPTMSCAEVSRKVLFSTAKDSPQLFATELLDSLSSEHPPLQYELQSVCSNISVGTRGDLVMVAGTNTLEVVSVSDDRTLISTVGKIKSHENEIMWSKFSELEPFIIFVVEREQSKAVSDASRVLFNQYQVTMGSISLVKSQIAYRLENQATVVSVDLVDDEQTVAIALSCGQVVIFDRVDDNATMSPVFDDRVTSLRWHPRGTVLALWRASGLLSLVDRAFGPILLTSDSRDGIVDISKMFKPGRCGSTAILEWSSTARYRQLRAQNVPRHGQDNKPRAYTDVVSPSEYISVIPRGCPPILIRVELGFLSGGGQIKPLDIVRYHTANGHCLRAFRLIQAVANVHDKTQSIQYLLGHLCQRSDPESLEQLYDVFEYAWPILKEANLERACALASTILQRLLAGRMPVNAASLCKMTDDRACYDLFALWARRAGQTQLQKFFSRDDRTDPSTATVVNIPQALRAPLVRAQWIQDKEELMRLGEDNPSAVPAQSNARMVCGLLLESSGKLEEAASLYHLHNMDDRYGDVKMVQAATSVPSEEVCLQPAPGTA